MPAPYTGGCQCGSVRYVLTTEPIRLVACHCKECQRQSGSAFGMSTPVAKDSLTVTGPTTLCCTDQQPGAVSPSERHLREADVLRPAKLEHAVQRGGSNGHLGRLPASGP
jgi:hypothetical protein